jgi:thioesterase domain-containing protein
VSYVYQLAAHLGNEQPIYGLRAVGLDGITAPLTTLEEIAAYYVQLITVHQPEGPLSLGGYSLGGVIAFEMARQLTHIGREVAVVMLIDAYPINPNANNHTQFPIRQLLRHYHYYWRSLPKQPSILWPVLQQKMPWVSQYLFGRFIQAVNKKEVSAAGVLIGTSVAEPESQLTKTFRQAYSQYTFKPYDGKVVFLRVAKDDLIAHKLNKVDFGWGRYARKGVDIHQLIGHHETIFSQPILVEQMAAIIQPYLNLTSVSESKKPDNMAYQTSR